MNRLPVLRRFDMTVMRPANPPSDWRQVVAPGAVVRIFGQGATNAGDVTMPSGVNQFDPRVFSVPHTGSIAQGDLLFPNGNMVHSLYVTAIANGPSPTITARNYDQQSSDFVIQAGWRLLTYGQEDWYSDALGMNAIGSSLVADANGKVGGYVRAYRYDIMISEVPDGPRIIIDLEGSFVMR